MYGYYDLQIKKKYLRSLTIVNHPKVNICVCHVPTYGEADDNVKTLEIYI